MNIMSINDIYNLLVEQAKLRSLENDEAGILTKTARYLINNIRELEMQQDYQDDV